MALALSLLVSVTTVVQARLFALPLPNTVHLKSYEAFSKTMSNFSELPCPLDKCNHGKGLFASKRFPQWFSLCTSKWHFCGVCSSGELFSPLKGRCFKSKWKPNGHFACLANRLCTPFKTTQGVVWLRKDDRSFILCTGTGNMCGFCPGNTRFNLEHQSCHGAEPSSLEGIQ
ncbi:hypothetical protein D918_08959 [Trichuris suis]|nr:hypothetical protein D918_08959 [Trichuris suis]